MASTEFDVESTLAKLNMKQKVTLLAGNGWWHTHAVPEAGVDAMRMSDGPNGVRGTQFFNGVPSSCFPSSTGLGSSFDVDLAQKVGAAIGDEARAKGAHILLAPTVNTQRSPLGGRGFESFSEDPHVNGTIAAAYINGVQSKGVAATIKHYTANDQEFERFSTSSEMSERALREIYLKPFQIAIKHSNPWALMTAYNRINGLHVSENKRILTDILKKEWKYEGMTMSDWIGVYSTTGAIKAGLDLEMPGPSVMREGAVHRALIGGKLVSGDIDNCVRKILQLLKRAHASGIPFDGPEEGVDTPELRQLLRTAAADATVLLKNENNILPLKAGIKKLAVIGPNAKYAFTSGGGSAQLRSTYTVSPLEGITAAAKEAGAEVSFAVGAAAHRYVPLAEHFLTTSGQPGAKLDFYNENPTASWMKQDTDLKAVCPEPVWSCATVASTAFLADGVDVTKVNDICWIRYTSTFTPDEDGDWEFGLNVAGEGNLYLDGKLVIDLSTNPEQGEAFFGLGTVDVRAVVKGLKAGQGYPLELRLNNASFIARGSPFSCRGGIRLGAIRQIDDEKSIADAVATAKGSDAVVLVVGLNYDFESEGFDRLNMDLPGLTNRLVSEVLAANPNTVIVNQSGTPVAMPWVKEAHTLVQAFYGGNELGNGLSDVLFGKVNPSGKLALSFPKRLEDNPSWPSFGTRVQEQGRTYYNEGIFVGYRGYEMKRLETLFPFGYGISYSSFEYSGLKASSVAEDGTFSVTFTINNTSKVDGREVVQIYLSDPVSSLSRPIKELKGFVKVVLNAGESKTETVNLDREAFAFYDDRRESWVAEAGAFEVKVAASSADVRLTAEIELKKSIFWTGL